MTTYTTQLGDTWDAIAYKVYGKEAYMTTLAAANVAHIEKVIFSAGIVLQVPDAPADVSVTLPPWKQGDTL